MTSSIERAESDVSEETTGASASIKFLVTNTLAGSIIGSKGTAIKELIEVSGARVSISGAQEFYPGTTDRVLLITGNLESLTTAIALIWELIYIHTKATATSQRVGVWSPEASKDALVAVDDIELTARLTVPAAAGGLLLGREGSTIRTITEASGAKFKMTSKDESLFTQERVVTLAGTVTQVRLCTELIVRKLLEDKAASTYVNRGTRYSPSASGISGLRGSYGGRRRPAEGAGGTDLAEAETTVTISVPDFLVGNIIGKAGATLREMTSLSGAKISISPRGEGGDSTRTVTIVGSPVAAQTAHAFCTEKLRQVRRLLIHSNVVSTMYRRLGVSASVPVETSSHIL